MVMAFCSGVGGFFLAFMCGRTACTLAPDEIIKACSYKDKKGKRRCCEWKDAPGGQQYRISYNMAPGSFTPVMLSSKHFKEVEVESNVDYVVMPMKWGLIPRWHKESPNKSSFKTTNCRGETMMEKPTYRCPLQQGRRCVVVMDGFYEWKTTESGKQPYFFQFSPERFEVKHENNVTYTPRALNLKTEIVVKDEISQPFLSKEATNELSLQQKSDIEVVKNCNETVVETEKKEIFYDYKTAGLQSQITEYNSKSSLKSGCNVNENPMAKEWEGKRLLTCAAVYDIWKPSSSSSPLYSYSIITVASSNDMSWCHHRMPAILTTDEEVCDWLDFAAVPLIEARKLIEPKSRCLTSHPVSKNVSNSKYQSSDCLKPIDLSESKKVLSNSGKMMMNWLKRSQASSSTPESPIKVKASKT